jgi:ornithine cyclodeaminase/alanine dehydrogenase-like protein (mu-crystallin family)
MLILSRRDVFDLLSLRDCIDAVEEAFRLHAHGRTLGPGVLGVPAGDGGFHVKAAGLAGERRYFAAKINANFPDNPRRFGLPAIQGTVVLSDATTGAPLAVMDSGSVTALRTGAATAVAAKYLARRDARTATIVGCGVQGATQLAALAAVLPLTRAFVLDTDRERAEGLAARSRVSLGFPVEARGDLRGALRESDVCVTCTPARRAFVAAGDVVPGTFIAAVGADNQGKQELAPELVAAATLVVDVLAQCAEIGELQHALAAGLLTRERVHAELADVVAGRRPGRTRADEITVFDSSGTALEDVAAAVAVYDNARRAGRGTEVKLDD